MISSLTKQNGKHVKPKKHKVSDDLLRAIVDACVSNVAVLDESGTILYASKAWRILERGTSPSPECFEISFEDCKRFTVPEFGADITLQDDLEEIVLGQETEFHRKYYCDFLADQKPFVMHAARLNVPGSSFRVLITLEETPFARESIRHSNERLSYSNPRKFLPGRVRLKASGSPT